MECGGAFGLGQSKALGSLELSQCTDHAKSHGEGPGLGKWRPKNSGKLREREYVAGTDADRAVGWAGAEAQPTPDLDPRVYRASPPCRTRGHLADSSSALGLQIAAGGGRVKLSVGAAGDSSIRSPLTHIPILTERGQRLQSFPSVCLVLLGGGVLLGQGISHGPLSLQRVWSPHPHWAQCLSPFLLAADAIAEPNDGKRQSWRQDQWLCSLLPPGHGPHPYTVQDCSSTGQRSEPSLCPSKPPWMTSRWAEAPRDTP